VLWDPLLSDYPRLSQQRKLIASVVVAGFDRVKIATGTRKQPTVPEPQFEPQLEFYRKFYA